MTSHQGGGSSFTAARQAQTGNAPSWWAAEASGARGLAPPSADVDFTRETRGYDDRRPWYEVQSESFSVSAGS